MNTRANVSPQILGIGSLLIDWTFYVSEDFIKENDLIKNGTKQDTKERVQEVWNKVKNESNKRLGGDTVNVLRGFAKLGVGECTLLGRRGGFKEDQLTEEELEQMGVQSRLIATEGFATGTVLCFITPDQERSMLVDNGALEEFTSKDIVEDKLPHFTHMHVGGYGCYFDIFAACVQAAQKKQATLSINLPPNNIIKKHIDQFKNNIKEFDYVVGNKEEFCELTGKDNIKEALEWFDIDQTIVITNGKENIVIREKNQSDIVTIAVPPIENIQNKTGGGDLGAAAFVGGKLKNLTTEQAGELLIAVASSWIQEPPGGTIPEKTWEVFKNKFFK